MEYATGLIEWYKLTQELIIQRFYEQHGRKISMDDLANAIRKKFNISDNTQAYDILYKEGLNLYNLLEKDL